MPKTAKTLPESLQLDRFLTYRLHVVSRLSDRESSAGYLRECGLSLCEGRCLAAIGSFEPVSLQDLARAANQDKAQASRAATSLVERGLVDKVMSQYDGRGVVLTVTAAGKPVYRRAMKLIEARNAAIFGALQDSERALLGTLLDRVATALRSQVGREEAVPSAATIEALRPVESGTSNGRGVSRPAKARRNGPARQPSLRAGST